MTLAFDICRCTAARDINNEPHTQCQSCRRYLEQEPSGPRSPWFVTPPMDDVGCSHHYPADDTD